MNCLSVSAYCFLDRPGGAERVAWDVASALAQRGHTVSMFCAAPGDRPADDETRHGVRIARYRLASIPAWHPLRMRRMIDTAAEAARRLLADQRFDVVHIHSPLQGAGVMQAFGDRTRYACTVHSPVVLEQRINWAGQGLVGRLKLLFAQGRIRELERRLLARAAAIQTLSRFTRDQLDRFHGLGRRITVIPHWVRPELARTMTRRQARDRLGWPADRPILFSLRRMVPRMGLDVAIRAAAPFVRQGRCLLMLGGDGPIRGQLEKLARELAAGEGIKFLGRLSDDQLALAYQAADLFLLPTRSLECFGLITMEAMAFGCPVLASDAGAIPEMVAPIAPGFIVPAGDAEALRLKIDDFLAGRLKPPSDDELVRYVQTNYSAEAVLPRIISWLGL